MCMDHSSYMAMLHSGRHGTHARALHDEFSPGILDLFECSHEGSLMSLNRVSNI